jgi:hypothetical protein
MTPMISTKRPILGYGTPVAFVGHEVHRQGIHPREIKEASYHFEAGRAKGRVA